MKPARFCCWREISAYNHRQAAPTIRTYPAMPKRAEVSPKVRVWILCSGRLRLILFGVCGIVASGIHGPCAANVKQLSRIQRPSSQSPELKPCISPEPTTRWKPPKTLIEPLCCPSSVLATKDFANRPCVIHFGRPPSIQLEQVCIADMGRGFPKIRGTLFLGPSNNDPAI